MKRLLIFMLAGLLVAGFVGTSFAWEFSMKGEYEFRLRYFGRTGVDDIFGNANLQEGAVGFLGWAPPGIGLAGPNIWNTNIFNRTAAGPDTAAGAGWRIARGGFSAYGSDAFYNDQRLTLRPTIRVNKAIRVFGVYNVGGLRNKYAPVRFANPIYIPIERYGVLQTSDAAYDTAAIGSWEQVRSTIYVPWGVFSIGFKDFPLGTGATLGYNTRAESFLTVVPYGPFRLLGAIWLARSAVSASYATRPDGDEKADQFWGFIATYDNADFDMGAGTIQRRYHANQAQVNNGRDGSIEFYMVYFKYNNGRWFANAEYVWFTLTRTPAVDTPPPAGITGDARDFYGEGYHFFAESGFVMGPLKFTAVAAIASGPVQSAGTIFGFPPPAKTYMPFAINYQAMEPYEWLMFNTYGGGNQEFNSFFLPSDGHGMMSDGYCFAGRIDFAVACNLNVWGSYIWAHRLETNGTWFAQYDPDGNANGLAGPAGRLAMMAQYGRTNPFVDDGYIGWECDLGVDWKLLEGLTFSARYAYWQPGDYWGQAYVGFGSVGGAAGFTMYRAISPIQAFEGKFLVEF